MSRRRLTWNGRMASAPPAMPGYQEPSVHPAAYPDPEADAYENGDPSSWAEDPHPGPYPNTMHPALPGTDAPMGHPATDPAHYFPAGVSKQASRHLRAAMEAKAARCIRIATAMLGRAASVSAIEDQALDLMNLTERQIQAALSRLSEDGMSQDVPTEASDLLALDNYTLTPERVSDHQMMFAMQDAMGEDSDEALLAEMMGEDLDSEEIDSDEGLLMAMLEEAGDDEGLSATEYSWSKTKGFDASGKSKITGKPYGEGAITMSWPEYMKKVEKFNKKPKKKAFGVYDQMPGDQNDPAHYNFEAEGVLKSAAEEEAEEMLSEMVEEEKKAKKAAALRWAKKHAEESDDESDADESDAEESEEAVKKAAHFKRLAAYWSRVAKKGEESDEDSKESEDEGEGEGAEKKAYLDSMADDLMMDDVGLEDPMMVEDSADVGMDELSMLYGGRMAKKHAEKSDDAEAEESDADAEEEEAPKSEKKAAVRPQPRKASNGLKTLGAVSKVASGDVNDLSKLWESAPDVSKIFG